MFARLCFGLIAMVAALSPAMSADVAPVQAPDAAPPVPGAHVTVESGVRVIRPVAPVSGANALEQADTRGSLVYRGAAFYRAPSATPHTDEGAGVETAPAKASE